MRIDSTTETPEQIKQTMALKDQRSRSDKGASSADQKPSNDSPDPTVAAQNGETREPSGGSDPDPIDSRNGESTEPSGGTEDDSKDPGEQTQDKDPAKPQKKKSSLRRKVEKQTREIEQLRLELQKVQTQPTSDKPKDQKPDPNEPKADGFDTHEEYLRAFAKYQVDKENKAQKATDRETEAKAEGGRRMAAYQKRANEYAKANPEFNEIVTELEGIQVKAPLWDAFLSAENGPQLVHHLAKDMAEFNRINSLPAGEAMRELGKFEVKLQQSLELGEKKRKEAEAKKSKAPTPPTPVGGKSGGAKSVTDSDISLKEFIKLRDAEDRGRRRI